MDGLFPPDNEIKVRKTAYSIIDAEKAGDCLILTIQPDGSGLERKTVWKQVS